MFSLVLVESERLYHIKHSHYQKCSIPKQCFQRIRRFRKDCDLTFKVTEIDSVWNHEVSMVFIIPGTEML